MSSAVLYLAIVAVWAIVLVPMWLRRDSEGFSPRRLLHRRADHLDDTPVLPPVIDDEPYVEDEHTGRPRVRRATVIARRRRRTLGLSTLVAASVGIVISGLAPWWVSMPPTVLLTGHLWMLRVAVQLDTTRREERRAAARRAQAATRRARREAEAETRRLAAEAAQAADIIELPAPTAQEVYDQYTDRRAVNN